MSQVNIFTRYEQEENHFTNALVSLLSMSAFSNPEFMPAFFKAVLGLDAVGVLQSFFVLKGIQGTADGELRNEVCCIQFETKIVSGGLRQEQILSHLGKLASRAEKLKKLILLTPDDSNSKYVDQFRALDSDHIIHLGWKRVYGFLSEFVGHNYQGVFAQLIRDFLDLIRNKVFEQDFVGIILKIDFGKKSEVYADQYLTEFEAGAWTCWRTPREYKSLDGTGRKLILYDRTRGGITTEVEIAKVSRTDEEQDYPWSNVFAPGTIRILRPTIPLEHIRGIKGLETFGVHRKDRNAFRKITHDQYRQLASYGIGDECRDAKD